MATAAADGDVERADPARLRDVGDRVGHREQGGRAAVVLVAERQADVAVQRRLVQRDGARGQLDGDHPQARGRRLLGRGDRARLGGRLRRSRWVPSAVLPTPGWDSGAVLPHSHRCSAPKAAAVRTIEPTLNGWPTESSSSASRAS